MWLLPGYTREGYSDTPPVPRKYPSLIDWRASITIHVSRVCLLHVRLLKLGYSGTKRGCCSDSRMYTRVLPDRNAVVHTGITAHLCCTNYAPRGLGNIRHRCIVLPYCNNNQIHPGILRVSFWFVLYSWSEWKPDGHIMYLDLLAILIVEYVLLLVLAQPRLVYIRSHIYIHQ